LEPSGTPGVVGLLNFAATSWNLQVSDLDDAVQSLKPLPKSPWASDFIRHLFMGVLVYLLCSSIQPFIVKLGSLNTKDLTSALQSNTFVQWDPQQNDTPPVGGANHGRIYQSESQSSRVKGTAQKQRGKCVVGQEKGLIVVHL
jgi:hypothetical protein